ncbi:ArgS-related anticodon-binding protein NrtL [Streptomyces sp. NPDC056479]|uniref:ArgS-related anticodon-binding protein NrtL n=1 Tax=Streptomyces sp. NPDC056479 TaxID=3345832 RepID=UPI0036A0FBEB
MTPVELSRTVLRAVRRAVDEGELSVSVPERVVVTVPGGGGCGDYATNVALQLARPAGQPSLRVAEILRPYLAGADGVADVVVTGPGFLNISLGGSAPAGLVEEILRDGPRYGYAPSAPSPSAESRDAGELVELSCPGEVRAVVVMDTVARILRSQGAAVRTRCEGEIVPQWADILGVRVDERSGQEQAAFSRYAVRPVPAPADPLPLGRDAARWALLHPAGHDRPRITDEHLVQRESNPLFLVRYAHARTRALSRNAADLGFTAEPGVVAGTRELDIVLADHPRVLARAAAHRAPDRLARHLVTVADAVLALLPAVLPLGAEKPAAAHRARLALAAAAGTVLAGGLSLLGIDAPDHL